MKFAVQQAVYTALSASPTYPVYDAVPKGTAPPYVVIGHWTGLPSEELSDADGVDATLTVHAWSSYAGTQECLAIREWLRAALHHQTLAGAWGCFEEFAEVFPEELDGERLYHLTSRYRIRI